MDRIDFQMPFLLVAVDIWVFMQEDWVFWGPCRWLIRCTSRCAGACCRIGLTCVCLRSTIVACREKGCYGVLP